MNYTYYLSRLKKNYPFILITELKGKIISIITKPKKNTPSHLKNVKYNYIINIQNENPRKICLSAYQNRLLLEFLQANKLSLNDYFKVKNVEIKQFSHTGKITHFEFITLEQDLDQLIEEKIKIENQLPEIESKLHDLYYKFKIDQKFNLVFYKEDETKIMNIYNFKCMLSHYDIKHQEFYNTYAKYIRLVMAPWEEHDVFQHKFMLLNKLTTLNL